MLDRTPVWENEDPVLAADVIIKVVGPRREAADHMIRTPLRLAVNAGVVGVQKAGHLVLALEATDGEGPVPTAPIECADGALRGAPPLGTPCAES